MSQITLSVRDVEAILDIMQPDWRDLKKSNGIIAEVNSHDLDSLRWFTGSEPVRAYAEAANFKCPDAHPKCDPVAECLDDSDTLGQPESNAVERVRAGSGGCGDRLQPGDHPAP